MKDYLSELEPEEIMNKDGRVFVFLKGLERLAHERGIKGTMSVVRAAAKEYAAVTYAYTFADGDSLITFEGSADACPENCNEGFDRYLVAIAESRAKSRALRTAFNITACSVEELGPTITSSEPEPAKDHQLHNIKHLMKEKDIGLERVAAILKRKNLKDIKDISREEAIMLIGKLNKEKSNG